MRKVLLLPFLAALATSAPGCVYPDLDLSGKRCDAASGCPGELICVEVPDSPTTRVGTCHEPDGAPRCQPDQVRCGAGKAWIEACEPDGHSWRVELVCQSGSGSECNPDIRDCSAACDAESDCASGSTCDLGTGLCRPMPACLESECTGLCVGQTCVPQAPGDASGSSGAPDLDCFPLPPQQPPAGSTCALTGRVNLFPSKAQAESAKALGLTVKLLESEPPYAEIDQVQVTQGADQAGYYTFDGVASNARYLIEVQAGTSDSGVEVVTTLNAPIDLRADHCPDGAATAGVSAMTLQNYQTYTTGTVEGLDPARGLIVGRVLDCRSEVRQAVGNVTVALAIGPVAPGRIYYFSDGDYLIPDLSLVATSVKGYYAAVGVPATRNQVAFAARRNISDLALGAVDFFLRPGAAAIVDLPLPEDRLPE